MSQEYLRALTINDLGAVYLLEQEVCSTNWDESSYLAELSKDQSVSSGMYVGDDLVAYVIAYVLLDELHVQDVVTKPAFRRRKAATAVLNYVFAAALERGAGNAFLEVREDNQAALGFYHRLGFEPYGRREDYYGPGTHAIMLKRSLHPPSATGARH